MESISLRIAFAVAGIVALVAATLYVIGAEIVAPNLKADLPHLAIIGFVWAISIPNIGRLRQLISDQKHSLK